MYITPPLKLTCSSTLPYTSIFSLLSSPLVKRSSPGLEAPNEFENSDLLPLVHPRLYWKVWQRTALTTNERTRTTNAHRICEKQTRCMEKIFHSHGEYNRDEKKKMRDVRRTIDIPVRCIPLQMPDIIIPLNNCARTNDSALIDSFQKPTNDFQTLISAEQSSITHHERRLNNSTDIIKTVFHFYQADLHSVDFRSSELRRIIYRLSITTKDKRARDKRLVTGIITIFLISAA